MELELKKSASAQLVCLIAKTKTEFVKLENKCIGNGLWHRQVGKSLHRQTIYNDRSHAKTTEEKTTEETKGEEKRRKAARQWPRGLDIVTVAGHDRHGRLPTIHL